MKRSSVSTILVIGAGLPRTGTMSLAQALQTLLGGECYHMKSVFELNDAQFWLSLHDRALPCTAKTFRQKFDDGKFVAGVDYPFSYYYKTLMDAYPNAKVVLSVREPKEWYQSMKNTVYKATCEIPSTFPHSLVFNLPIWPASQMGRQIRMARAHDEKMWDSVISGEEASVKFYNEWVDEVKATVPKDKMLVFSVNEGWEPLCSFLGLPVPNGDFPNLNKAVEMQKNIQGMTRMSWMIFSGLTTAAVGSLAMIVNQCF